MGCAYRFRVSLGFAARGMTVAMHGQKAQGALRHLPFMPKIYMMFLLVVQMDQSQLYKAQLAFRRCSPVVELIGQASIGYI